MKVLTPVSRSPYLTLVIDVDTLERSALARIDRVMLLALDGLARAGVQVVLAARHERDRAARLQLAIREARCLNVGDGAVTEQLREHDGETSVIMVSGDPSLFVGLTACDRGVALGRHELVSSTIAAASDGSVRATLWWLLEARLRRPVEQR